MHAGSHPEVLRHRSRGAVAAAAMVVLFWLLDVTHHGLPRRLEQVALAAAAVLGAWALANLVRRLWRGDILDRASGRVLLLVTGAALLVQAIGLGHEIGGLYFADEGWFLAEAKRINTERALRAWFAYPHFLFYWDALALWVADLCGPIVPTVARAVWGVEGALNVGALVTRCGSALLAALASVPVFLAARRLALASDGNGEADSAAGVRAGLAAGLLLALSPTLVEVGHFNLSDVPAAFWSACTAYGVVLLLERETLRRYLLTGAAAGLAAGSKYPAGIVAVAIAAVWLRGVVQRRRPDARLAWAALAAIAAFLLTTPSLLRFPGIAFGAEEGHADIFFGVRLYSGGWHGVVRHSNALYYLDELLHAFGWPAFALGAFGVATLAREPRRRLLWLLLYPLVHLLLLLRMDVAVRRNVMPVLPFVAIVLGVGLAGLFAWLLARRRRSVAAAAAILAVVVPVAATAVLLVRYSRPTTRDAAAAWMRAHLPPGSFLVQERYTPLVGPEELFPARHPRFAARLERAVLHQPMHDYLLLSSEAYQRFFAPDNLENLASDATVQRYREIFATYPLVREWTAGRFQDGPTLRLYRLDPEPADFAARRALTAADALVSAPEMKTSAGIEFTRPGQWALFKTTLTAGPHHLRIDDNPSASGRLRVRTREKEGEDNVAIVNGEASMNLSDPAKAFLYVEIVPTARVTGLTITGD